MAMLEVLSFILVSIFTNAVFFPGFNQVLFTNGLAIINESSTGFILLGIIVCVILKYYQSKMRYARLLHIKMKYGFDSADPTTYERMTVEQAQEIERNLAEWEFPRLFQFAWISDFLRTSTNPGVSRTIVHSGHFLDPNPLISHRRQQDTIHLMTAIAAYPVKSRFHSLAIARINEHHHRYGTKINSDDVLYLVIHFGLAPISWIQRFGYRQLEEFEMHALWVLWRELGCRMGVKYIPETLEQTLKWRKQFETHWRWPEKANQDMAMGLLNQIIYPIPSILHPFARKVVASIMDYDIVYYNMLEHLGPSSMLRSVIFDLFTLCGWMIRHFGLPRTKPYQRSPEKANAETGLVNFDYTPYETTPFYIAPSKWNLYGPGAMLRRLRGIPLPSSQFFGDGIAFESMGAPFKNPTTQSAVEEKVRRQAKILETAPYGYRPNVGFQATRLLGPIEGHSYGFLRHSFDKSTKYSAAGPHRFDKEFERRGSAYSGLDEITTPDDVEATHGDI